MNRTLTPLAMNHAARDWATFRDLLTGREYRATGLVVRAAILPAEVRAGDGPEHGWWSYKSAATIREMFAGDSLGQRVDLAIWQNQHPAPPRNPTVTEDHSQQVADYVPWSVKLVMDMERRYYGRDCHDIPQVCGNSGWLAYQCLAILREGVRS